MGILANWKKFNGFLFMQELARSAWYSKIIPGKKAYVYRQKYGNRRKLTAEQTNEAYRRLIESGKPFLAGRMGTAEMLRVNRYLMIKLGLKKHYSARHMRGVFQSTPEAVDWFAERVIELMPHVDIMPAWCLLAEPFLIRNYAKKAQICQLEDIEPFFYEKPWTAALKGKKVMVINPFDESIRKQYAKREMLFENPEMLPEFELHTVKSVMVLSPEYNVYGTMEDAINYMYNEAMKVDFDIALLGCGAMGMLLAEKIRQQGKQAIYLGGVLQILFGIRGKRWDNAEHYQKFFNEHWIYPIEAPPEGAERLDGSCYWK